MICSCKTVCSWNRHKCKGRMLRVRYGSYVHTAWWTILFYSVTCFGLIGLQATVKLVSA
jgi:hypothetical protein